MSRGLRKHRSTQAALARQAREAAAKKPEPVAEEKPQVNPYRRLLDKLDQDRAAREKQR